MRLSWWRRPGLRIAALAGVALALALWQAVEPWLFPGPVVVSPSVYVGTGCCWGNYWGWGGGYWGGGYWGRPAYWGGYYGRPGYYGRGYYGYPGYYGRGGYYGGAYARGGYYGGRGGRR